MSLQQMKSGLLPLKRNLIVQLPQLLLLLLLNQKQWLLLHQMDVMSLSLSRFLLLGMKVH
jgi:hypothetical protein